MPFQDEESWEIRYQSFWSDDFYGCERWSELLSHKRTVVLAEAGAGKTAEFRHKAKELIAQNSLAFYVTVHDLAKKSFRDALDAVADESRFDAWISSNEEGIFLIDSVDEARINGESFKDALKHLAKAIHRRESRATILVSCRVSDWKATQDRAKFEEILGKPPDVQRLDPLSIGVDDEALFKPLFPDTETFSIEEDEQRQPTEQDYLPHIVALAPLTIEQSKRLAEHSEVKHPDNFIEAVRSADVEDLANRPQDLLALASFWKDKGVMGSKYDALKWSIQQRLRESNPDLDQKDTLSESKAYEGAKLIAAAMTFGHKRFIAWPLDTPGGDADELSINPKDALLNWSPQEQKMLLNRAVFDPATHGRVRFHHRSVQELLCAEWLIVLIEAGCPVCRIKALLSEEKYGRIRLRPSLRPVTAWLAQLNNQICNQVLPIAPELLIEGGDPALLSIQIREHLLDQFAKVYCKQDDAGIGIDFNQIKRLADAALAPKVQSLWMNAGKSGELRDLLLRIIRHGKLESCADIALAAATGIRDGYERALGAQILAAIGTSKQQRELANYLLQHASSYPQKAIADALRAVFPSALSLEELETLIKKSPAKNLRCFRGGLSYGLSEIIHHSQLPDPEALATLLYNLVSQKPWVDPSHGQHSSRFKALLEPLSEICANIIQTANNSPVSETVTQAVCLIGTAYDYSANYQTKKTLNRLREAIRQNTGVNRQQFWLSVEKAGKDRCSRFGYQALFGGGGILWQVNARDFDWLLKDLREREEKSDRKVVLGATYWAWNSAGRIPAQLDKIGDAISQDEDLKQELDNFLNPPVREEDEWKREHKKRMEEIKAKQAKERAEAEENWRDFRDRLVNNPNVIKDGSDAAIHDLYSLTYWMQKKLVGRSTYSHHEWQTLAQPFSMQVAEAARDGFVAFWRTYDPGEGSARDNKTPYLQMSLIGLAIESKENPSFIAHCSSEEMLKATRIALHELNYFPEWAPQMWFTRAKEAEKILRPEIRWEFENTPGNGVFDRVVQGSSHTKEPLRSLAASWVLAELEEGSLPVHMNTLQNAIDTIVDAETDFTERLAHLAEQSFASEEKRDHRLLWLAIWLGVKAEPALEALDIWLQEQESTAEQDNLIIQLLNIMFGHGPYKFGVKYQDFTRFDPLCRLLEIVNAHVRYEDDHQREGCYTPDERDNAEDARSVLLSTLCDIPGERTYQKLIEMSQSSEFRWRKERLRVFANRRATADAELKSMRPEDIIAFSENYEKLPLTLKELHDVVLDRLVDIKNDIRVGQFTNKVAWRQDHLGRADERTVQLGIADQLNLRAKGAYSVTREPELGSHDEPDIFIQRAGINEPVPVEIKVADSWSYQQLCDAISKQLIGKYMKPRAATHGHLIMTYHGKKKSWRSTKGRKQSYNFPNLVDALQRVADNFVHNDPNVMKISITGIDLTD